MLKRVSSEFAYPHLEGRSIHSKTSRRAIGTCNNPITLLERLEDLLTLSFLQKMLQRAFVVEFGAAALSSG